jgi:hypothetical protein
MYLIAGVGKEADNPPPIRFTRVCFVTELSLPAHEISSNMSETSK